MKILMIDQKYTPYKAGTIPGGIQLVVDKQLKLLANHHEVFFLTHANSEAAPYEGVMTILSPVASKHEAALKGRKYNDARNAHLEAVIANNQPDLIINHDQSNNSIVKVLTRLDYPSITYVHDCTEVIGGISGFGYVQTMHDYQQSGGMVVNVSETSMHQWRAYAIKNEKYIQKPDLVPEELFANFHITPWFDDILFEEKERDGGVIICRMQKDKGALNAIKMHVAAERPLAVCHPTPRDDKEREYFDRCKAAANSNITFHIDLTRADLFAEVSRHSYLVVSSAESFGITAVEAALMGLNVVLIFKEGAPHPTEELFGKILKQSHKFFRGTTKDKYFFAGDKWFQPALPEESRILAEVAKFYFSEGLAYARLSVLIEKCINSYDKTEIITL